GITGGTEKLRTKFAFNYQNADGYYVNRSYERYAGRLNNDYKIADWISAKIDFDMSKSRAVNPSTNNGIYDAYRLSPYYTPRWEDGRHADVKDGSNALAALEQGGTDVNNYYKLGGKAQLDI